MNSSRWGNVARLTMLFGTLLLTGCAYARLGRLIYIPSDKDPKKSLYMGATDLERGPEKEIVATKKLIEIYFRDRSADERLATYRKKIKSRDLDWDYRLTRDRLIVTAKESAEELVFKGFQAGVARYEDQPNKKPLLAWKWIFARQADGKFALVSEQGDFSK